MSSSPQPVADLLAALQGALAALGVRWFLFGAQAAILYGVVRLSADVDVTVDLGKRSATDLVAALATAGFELRIPDAAGFAEERLVLAGRLRDLDDVAAIARVRRDDLDLDKIRVTLRMLERALDRSDLVSELERVVAAARRLPPDPRA